MKINKKSKIFIAGHNGMVGSSLCRKFNENGFKNIITVEKKKTNLLDQKAVFKFLKKKKTRSSDYCCCKSWRYLCKFKL